MCAGGGGGGVFLDNVGPSATNGASASYAGFGGKGYGAGGGGGGVGVSDCGCYPDVNGGCKGRLSGGNGAPGFVYIEWG